jgi:hypothetical protein
MASIKDKTSLSTRKAEFIQRTIMIGVGIWGLCTSGERLSSTPNTTKEGKNL